MFWITTLWFTRSLAPRIIGIDLLFSERNHISASTSSKILVAEHLLWAFPVISSIHATAFELTDSFQETSERINWSMFDEHRVGRRFELDSFCFSCSYCCTRLIESRRISLNPMPLQMRARNRLKFIANTKRFVQMNCLVEKSKFSRMKYLIVMSDYQLVITA